MNTNHSHHIPTVLTIAGSDPSGGAGIQADLKTFTALRVYGAAVITALTAQNTQTVTATMPVPADFVRKQLDAVLSDIEVDVIKLGMIPNAQICEVISPFLKGRTVVCDPVMASTSGYKLMDDAAVTTLVTLVISNSTFLAPNLNELKILCEDMGRDIISAGEEILQRFANLSGIVLKGGHINADSDLVTDILIYRDGSNLIQKEETHPRYQTKNTHGTGCTFSSAFAAFLAKKHDPAQAFSKAVSFVDRLIAISKDAQIGHGNGPLLHHMFPSTSSGNATRTENTTG